MCLQLMVPDNDSSSETKPIETFPRLNAMERGRCQCICAFLSCSVCHTLSTFVLFCLSKINDDDDERKKKIQIEDTPVLHYNGTKKPDMPKDESKRGFLPPHVLAQQDVSLNRAKCLDFESLKKLHLVMTPQSLVVLM